VISTTVRRQPDCGPHPGLAKHEPHPPTPSLSPEVARRVLDDRMGALATLAAGVADEVNNPLTYVLLNLDHAMRRLRSLSALDPREAPPWPALAAAFAELVDTLAKASEGANRVRGITRDILVFAQGDPAPRGLVDVRAVVESSLQVAWHELRHRARVVRKLLEVPPVAANATPLAHVFLHLLVNAARAIPEGSAERKEIHVGTRCDESGDVVVEIRDAGGGISPDDIEHVFEPFFTTHRRGSGHLGLGLSICHGIVRQLGGELTAHSTQDEGTTFRVVLPAGRSPSASGIRARASAARRVLVVEADPLVSEAIVRSLEGSDLSVATDASRAIELIAGGDFDLVLCDVMLPGASGIDFYVDLLRVAPDRLHRVVFMAGGPTTTRARAFLAGITNPCLEKPLDLSQLRRLVDRAG
jgi:two-component system NtrC family sensor kinase